MNHIIEYKLFESFEYADGCLMFDIDNQLNWKDILSSIKKEDIYDSKSERYGLQKRPHLTLLYPIKRNVSFEKIKDVLDESLTDAIKQGIDLDIQSIDFFDNKDYDILYLKCKSSKSLSTLRNKLKDNIPNKCVHRHYKPHITIAYLKKGEAKKYCKDFSRKIKKLDKITYTLNGKDSYYNIKSENINENKMWYKTIPQILEWFEFKSEIPWLWIDTETTGLLGPKKEQITQISSIATNYDFVRNQFSEIDFFDEKIKLTDNIKLRYNLSGDSSRKILSFNRYGSGNYTYKEEKDVIDDFFNWVNQFENKVLLVAQNAPFDMSMLGGRYNHKIIHEVFDTKMLIQLYFLPLLQKLAETDSKYASIIKSIGTSPRDNGLISSSMSKIGPVLGINMSGYHDALTDCRITIEMYTKIIDLLKMHNNVDIMKYQAERIKTIRLK